MTDPTERLAAIARDMETGGVMHPGHLPVHPQWDEARNRLLSEHLPWLVEQVREDIADGTGVEEIRASHLDAMQEANQDIDAAHERIDALTGALRAVIDEYMPTGTGGVPLVWAHARALLAQPGVSE